MDLSLWLVVSPERAISEAGGASEHGSCQIGTPGPLPCRRAEFLFEHQDPGAAAWHPGLLWSAAAGGGLRAVARATPGHCAPQVCHLPGAVRTPMQELQPGGLCSLAPLQRHQHPGWRELSGLCWLGQLRHLGSLGAGRRRAAEEQATHHWGCAVHHALQHGLSRRLGVCAGDWWQ